MMASDLPAVLAAVRNDGQQRMAHCPAHDDRNASLSVGRGEDERILLHCKAGCNTEAVLKAVGLTWADLSSQIGAQKPKRRIVATYDYRDEHGTPQYQVVREEPKGFKQRRSDGAGGWIWNMTGVTRVPYRLNELQGHPLVLIAEGEKDVDRLWRLGIPATTNAGGAGKWSTAETTALKHAGVERAIVIPDNDVPGRKHAENVVAHLSSAGIATSIVALPDVAEHGDVSDWLAAGHTKEELQALIARAPHKAAHNRDLLALTSIGDLLAESDEATDWLVDQRIPAGGTVIVAAKPKVGKSTVARDLALAIARGDAWLGHQCHAGTVWYFAFEGRRRDIRRTGFKT